MKIINGCFNICYLERMEAAGHASNTGYRSGYEGSVEVNFLGFITAKEDTYLIQIDTLFIDEDFKVDIEKSVKSKFNDINIICISSHSHSLPGIDLYKPKLGKINSHYRELIKEKIIENLIQRIPKPDLKEISFSRHKKYSKLSIGRRGSKTKSNFSLLALRNTVPDFSNVGSNIEITCLWSKNKTKVLAIIWTFPAHPVLYSEPNNFSADFPGQVRDLLRKEFKNDELTVLYFPGCAGDMRPFINSQSDKKSLRDFLIGQPFSDCDSNNFKEYCIKLKEDLIDCFRNNMIGKDADLLEDINYQKKLIPLKNIGLKSHCNEFLSVEMIKFNNIKVFAFLNCEPSYAYHNLFENDCTVTGYSSGVFGYLPTDDQIYQGGYEVSGFMPFFGTSGSFVQGIRKVIKDECVIN